MARQRRGKSLILHPGPNSSSHVSGILISAVQDAGLRNEASMELKSLEIVRPYSDFIVSLISVQLAC